MEFKDPKVEWYVSWHRLSRPSRRFGQVTGLNLWPEILSARRHRIVFI